MASNFASWDELTQGQGPPMAFGSPSAYGKRQREVTENGDVGKSDNHTSSDGSSVGRSDVDSVGSSTSTDSDNDSSDEDYRLVEHSRPPKQRANTTTATSSKPTTVTTAVTTQMPAKSCLQTSSWAAGQQMSKISSHPTEQSQNRTATTAAHTSSTSSSQGQSSVTTSLRQTDMSKRVSNGGGNGDTQRAVKSGGRPSGLTVAEEREILEACWYGKVNWLTQVLEQRPKINVNLIVNNKDNFTPLHLAILNGQHRMAKMLIEKAGADPNLQSKGGATALHSAAAMGDEQSVDFLISHCRVPADVRDADGDTPLNIATKSNFERVVYRLVSTGSADPKIRNNDGLTATHIACYHETLHCLKILMSSAKFSQNVRDRTGRTPLLIAAEQGKTYVADILLRHPNTDPNIRDCKGNTALHVVASQGHTEMARLILSTKKANVNIQNNAGDTPLHDGIRSFSVDVVQLLVDTKNCENVKNKSGKSPFDLPNALKIYEILRSRKTVSLSAKTVSSIADNARQQQPQQSYEGPQRSSAGQHSSAVKPLVNRKEKTDTPSAPIPQSGSAAAIRAQANSTAGSNARGNVTATFNRQTKTTAGINGAPSLSQNNLSDCQLQAFEQAQDASENLKAKLKKLSEISDSAQIIKHQCPVVFRQYFTAGIMTCPVVASDGHTYDYDEITAWLRNHDTSPRTGNILKPTLVYPNIQLLLQILEWVEEAIASIHKSRKRQKTSD